MRIPSGKTDVTLAFVAVDATDLKTREVGLTGFTVYYSRNGAAPVLYTTPTVTELSAANMPGVYVLLADEGTAIASSSDSEEYCVHITQASMAPVTRVIELYRRDTTSGRTIAVDASGRALVDVDTIKTNPVVNAGTLTFPSGATLASTTNITAGTITTATNLTNLPTIPANWLTAAGTAADFGAEIADAVWDELMAGHTTADSAGKRLQDISGLITSSGTAQAGTGTTITLVASASSSNLFDPGLITLTGGTGAGQSREIVDYNTTTKVATVSRNWKVTPDATTTYVTHGAGPIVHSNEGIAAAGSASTITLNATAASGTDTLKGQLIWICAGTGQDQVGIIEAYDGTTKIATMGRDWVVTPDSTSVYMLFPIGPAMVFDYENTTLAPLSVAGTEAAVWDAILASYIDAGSTGFALNAAGSAGDPWGTALPGGYSAGTAGNILGNRLDVAVSTLATAANLATVAGYIDTEVAAIKAKTDNLPASPAATGDIPTVGAIADQVWDELLSGHAGGGSAGAALSAAGSAGDPWSTPLPGAYGSGTAGKIIGDNINATVSSRASQTSVDTIDDFLDTEVAAIKAKTDLIPASPAAVSDIPTAATVADSVWDEALSGHAGAGSGGAALAAVREYADNTVIRGTVSGTSPTTTTFTCSALSPAGVDADQFKGRIIVFDTDTTTTGLRGQATDITASSAAGLPLLTFTALTTAPQSGDTFSIL